MSHKMKEICELKLENNKLEFVDSTDEQYEWPYSWDKKELTFAVIQGTSDAGVFSKLRKAVGLSFSTWGAEIDLKFRRVSKNNSPDITIKFVNNSSQDDYLAEKPSVLAYAYYPKTGKQGTVVFNDYNYHWSTDGKPVPAYKLDPTNYSKGDGVKFKTYNIMNVLTHELGHTLGLSHSTIQNGRDMMDPIYDRHTVQLSYYDKERIVKKYGIRIWKRVSLYERFLRIINFRKNRL